MRLTAKADYALRAVAELAASASHRPVKTEHLAEAQQIPAAFLVRILADLRRAGVVRSQRGAEGGYRLGRAADEISLADVIRAVEGPLAEIRGDQPQDLDYSGSATALQDVWIALRASERRLLESITVAHVAKGSLPAFVDKLTKDPDAWARR